MTPIAKGKRSVVDDARQVALAIDLIDLGARLQVLQNETGLSRERLLKLYREVKGVSPSKGMLPFSVDWFLTWQPNVHASLFIEIHRYLTNHTGASGAHAMIKCYRLYLEHVAQCDLQPVLSFTRAWTLLRFIGSDMLVSACCTRCGGNYVVHPLDLHDKYVCGLCVPPSRAGKPARPRADSLEVLTHAA